MGFIERVKQVFGDPGEDGSRRKAGSRLLLLLVVGVGLLIINSVINFTDREPAPEVYEPPGHTESLLDEHQSAAELAAMLNQIRGVSNVKIFVTAETSGRLELVEDLEHSLRQITEIDSGGGSRETIEETERRTFVILRDAQGRETPLVIQEKQPSYRGVLVVADGVENPVVRSQVIEALRSVLGLPYHRITVLPRGGS